MFSINVTVHNKAFLIQSVLERILKFTTGSYELVLVFDGCVDNSFEIADTFCKNNNIKPKVFFTDDVYETTANNVAARNSEGDYVFIVQDDTLMNEPAWNERLLKPFLFGDVVAVSGNCSHNWAVNPNSVDMLSDVFPNRSCDILLVKDVANKHNTDRNLFAIRDSVNRSPLVLNHDIFRKLGYFDEIYAPQSMDDHDLMYRARYELDKICGLIPVEFETRWEWSGTTDGAGRMKPWFYQADHKNMRILHQRHADKMKCMVESRVI